MSELFNYFINDDELVIDLDTFRTESGLSLDSIVYFSHIYSKVDEKLDTSEFLKTAIAIALSKLYCLELHKDYVFSSETCMEIIVPEVFNTEDCYLEAFASIKLNKKSLGILKLKYPEIFFRLTRLQITDASRFKNIRDGSYGVIKSTHNFNRVETRVKECFPHQSWKEVYDTVKFEIENVCGGI